MGKPRGCCKSPPPISVPSCPPPQAWARPEYPCRREAGAYPIQRRLVGRIHVNVQYQGPPCANAVGFVVVLVRVWFSPTTRSPRHQLIQPCRKGIMLEIKSRRGMRLAKAGVTLVQQRPWSVHLVDGAERPSASVGSRRLGQARAILANGKESAPQASPQVL